MPNFQRLLAVLALVAVPELLVPVDGDAQLPPVRQIEPALLRRAADKYELILERGNDRQVMGHVRLTLTPSDSAQNEWILVHETEAGPTRLVDSLWLGAADAYPRRQVVRGSAGTLDLTFTRERVSGVVVNPAGQREQIDSSAEDAIFAESGLGVLVRLIRLQAGVAFAVPSFGQAFGLSRAEIRVVGLEEIKVSAGARRAWRIDVKTGSLTSTVWLDPESRLDIRAITDLPDGTRMVIERVDSAAALRSERASAAAHFDIPETLLSNLRERVAEGWAPGFVVGIVDARGPQVYGIGTLAFGDTTPVTGATIYEIGSVTKAITGVLLAEMVERGEVTLDTHVSTLAPQLQGSALGAITLRHLASHRSGLMRDPPDLSLDERTGNPFAAYDAARLWRVLRDIRLARAPGSTYEYSNLGFGLLGEALAAKTGRRFDDLLRERVLSPLGMSRTASIVAPENHRSLAPPYRDRRPVSSWDFHALHAAGALRSSADDLLRLLAAAAGVHLSPLDAAFRLAEATADSLTSDDGVGLGWHVLHHKGHRVVWHDGGSGGYRSLIGYDRERGFGVVVLTNSTESLDDVSAHLLDPNVPLPPVQERRMLASALAAEFVGDYDIGPAFSLSVSSAPEHLEVRGTGQAPLAAWWSGGDRFFYRTVAAELVFTRDKSGHVDGVVLHQNGVQHPGKRRK